MTEDVLQYIWQLQSFNNSDLKTKDGEGISIIEQGELNLDSGPDFSSAKISINGIDWAGDIEIHTKSSLWDAHKHNNDLAYNKVILHVVWEDDKVVRRKDGTIIPTLELQTRLSKDWLDRYTLLMSAVNIIPCESFISAIDRLVIQDAINNALVQRLEAKSNIILATLEEYNGDWNRTALIIFFENFGLSKNKEAFRNLASILDFKVLSKLNTLLEIEAYFFGMAGLIPEKVNSGYTMKLKEEFIWIQHKFKIAESAMSSTWWKFMRMRPANFPTLRIAQLAAFFNQSKNIARDILEYQPSEFSTLFKASPSDFWLTHYHFNKEREQTMSQLGYNTRALMVINVVSPFLIAYGKFYDDLSHIKRSIDILENLKAESNRIVRKWREFGVKSRNASESQGLIELFNNYCKKNRCLSCSIGQSILNSE